jgi:hypothetical protein
MAAELGRRIGEEPAWAHKRAPMVFQKGRGFAAGRPSDAILPFPN